MSHLRAELERICADVGLDLGREFRLRPPRPDLVPDLPPPLRDLYAACDGGNLGFGELFDLAHLRVVADGFGPNWVPFGFDHRFSFWLCARAPAGELWFAEWDHASGTEIGTATEADLVSFLRDAYRRRLSGHSPEQAALVLASVPGAARAATVLALKTACVLGTASALEMLRSLPVELPVASIRDAHAALVRLRAQGVEGHLRLDFF